MRPNGFPEHLPGISPPEKTLREQLKILRTLMQLIWPKGKAALKARVCIAFGFMLSAKLFNMLVPYFYKGAVDHLSGHAGAIIKVPVGLILFYGLARVLAQATDEFQDWIFSRVAQRAVRRVALDVLRHLHAMSLSFHFDRQTGSLNRALERGSAGIESLMSFMLFNITPIILEILLMAAVLWHFYDVNLQS